MYKFVAGNQSIQENNTERLKSCFERILKKILRACFRIECENKFIVRKKFSFSSKNKKIV